MLSSFRRSHPRLAFAIGLSICSTIFFALALVALGPLGDQSVAPSSGAAERMEEAQVIALRCAGKGASLRAGARRWRPRGVPQVQSPICFRERNWVLLPRGWTYGTIEDANTRDGTFKFSARSRAGEAIVCTEQGCSLANRGEAAR